MELLASTLIGGLGLLLLCWAVTARLRTSAAATRHAVWMHAFVGSLLLPVVASVAPTWTMPFRLPHLMQAATVPVATPVRAAERERPSAAVALPSTGAPPIVIGQRGPRAPSGAWLVFALWITGAGILIGDMLRGQLRAYRVVRYAKAVRNPRIQSILRECERAMAIRRPVAVRSTTENVIPFIHGLWRPVIVMPAGFDLWPNTRVRAVFAHELTHARRHDAWSTLLVGFTRAMHWPNPLIWLAARRATHEMECACDDAVLSANQDATHYARELLDLARSLSPLMGGPQLAVIRSTGLEARIRSILLEGRPRVISNAPVRRFGMACACAVGLLSSVRGSAEGSKVVATAQSRLQPPSVGARDSAVPRITTMSVAQRTEGTSPLVEPAPAEQPVTQAANPLVLFLPTIAGVCGRGIPDEITFSRGSSVDTSDCLHGLARITVSYDGTRVSDVHATVGMPGGVAPASSAVPLSELLAAVPNLDGRAASRAIQAMALVARGAAPEQLLAFARDTTLAREARRMAVTWFDIVAGEDGVDALAEIARSAMTELSVREQAFIALGDRGTAIAVELAQHDSAFRRTKLNRFARAGQ